MWNIIHSINNDTQEIKIEIMVLGNGINYLIKCGEFYSVEKLALLQKQIEELKQQIHTLTKIKILEALEEEIIIRE